MPEETSTTEEVILHTPGAIPGIPGESHPPGRYLIDWIKRTATRIEELFVPEPEAVHIEERVSLAPIPEEQATAPTATAGTEIQEE